MGSRSLLVKYNTVDADIMIVNNIYQVRPDIQSNVVMIDDPYGPAIVLPEIQCIVASQETEAGCVSINKKRKEAGGLLVIVTLSKILL